MPTYRFTSPNGTTRTFSSKERLSKEQLENLKESSGIEKVPGVEAAISGQTAAAGAVGKAAHSLLTSPEKQKALGQKALELGKREALPIAGTILGNTPIGRSIKGGAAVGRFVGGVLGEGANQALGITEPSIPDLLISGATGAVAGGTPRTIKAGTRGLAAFAAPSAMKAQGANIAREKFGSVGSKAIFAQFKKMPAVRGQKIIEAAQTALNSVRRPRAKRQLKESLASFQETQSLTVAKGHHMEFTETFQIPKEHISYDDITKELQRIRAEAKSAFKAGDTNSGADLSEAAEAMISELDKISPIIKQANAAYRREKAVEEIAKALRGGNVVSKIDNLFDFDHLVSGAFSGVEKEAIRDLTNDVARITSATVAGRFVMPAIEPIAEMMTNQRGRNALKFLLKQTGMNVNTLAATAGQILKGQFGRFNVMPQPSAPQGVQ